MPLQNRVDPWGQLHAVAARGLLLGNRGCLHDENRRVVRPWQRRAWVTCELESGGIRRNVFGPSTYSELFFLDEATAFAAGHRPCASCRRARYDEFKRKWLEANGAQHSLGPDAPIGKIDEVLHWERCGIDRDRRSIEAFVADLVFGTLVELDGQALLMSRQGLFPWSHFGYSRLPKQPVPSTRVTLLTPESVARAFSKGFEPTLHPTASA